MSVAPDAPNISIRPKCGDQTIELFWQPPASDGGSAITGYGIGLYDTGGGVIFSNSVGPTIRRLKLTGLTNGLKYVPKVRAINAIGNGPEAVYRTVEPGLRPSVPENAAAEIAGESTALVTWETPSGDGGADIGWYVVESNSVTNPGDPAIKFSAHGYDRERYVTGLSPSEYTFNVYAVNDPGYSIAAVTNSVNFNTDNGILVYLFAPFYSGSGPWLDDSGKGRNATIETGTVTKNADGNGIVLDGSTGWRFDPIGSHNAWTVIIWFKRTGPSSSLACLVTELYTGTTINIFLPSNGEGPSSSQFAGGFFDGSFQLGAAQTFPLNEWHPIAVTWDGTDIKTYFDGVLVDTTNKSGYVSSSVSNNYYRIGRRWDTTDYVQGEIGEVSIHSRALSNETILNNFFNSFYFAIVKNVTIDIVSDGNLLGETIATTLESSWTIGYPYDTRIYYYYTDSSTVPPYPGGTSLGFPGYSFSVAPGTTTHTVPNNNITTRGVYYFVAVSRVGDPEENAIRSPTAILLPFYPGGSIDFTYIPNQGEDGLGPDTQYQYLTMSPGLSFANDDFTIEFWIKPGPRDSFDDDHSEGAGIIGRGDINGLSLFFYKWQGLTIRSGPTFTAFAAFPSDLEQDTWYYINVERNGAGFIIVRLNGTMILLSLLSPNESACSSASSFFGYNPEDRKYITAGYLSSIRVVIGSLVYGTNGDISVPTAPPANTTNTKLLLTLPTEIPATDESGTQTLTNTSAGGQAVATWSSDDPF